MDTVWRWKRLYPERQDVIQIILDLHTLNSIINVRYPEIFSDPWFLGLQINPIVIRLICQHWWTPMIDSLVDGTGALVEKAFRLAALIYLADVRVKCMEYHITGYHFMEDLKGMVLLETMEWQDFPGLRLWVLVIGGMKASMIDRPLFAEATSDALAGLNINTWEEATKVVTNFLWVEEIYRRRCREFGAEVMNIKCWC
jgi:hypothetical protein